MEGFQRDDMIKFAFLRELFGCYVANVWKEAQVHMVMMET